MSTLGLGGRHAIAIGGAVVVSGIGFFLLTDALRTPPPKPVPPVTVASLGAAVCPFPSGTSGSVPPGATCTLPDALRSAGEGVQEAYTQHRLTRRRCRR